MLAVHLKRSNKCIRTDTFRYSVCSDASFPSLYWIVFEERSIIFHSLFKLQSITWKFPFFNLMKYFFWQIMYFIFQTYNTDSQVGDSGACATALLCGVKGRFETVGLDDSGRYDNCQSSLKSRIPCLADWAQAEGKTDKIILLIIFIIIIIIYFVELI